LSGKDLIVKDNRLVEASYRLDLCEQRLMLLAIVRAREAREEITAATWLEVAAKDYADTYGITKQAAYMQLKTAADALFSRQVQLIGVDEKTGKDGVLKTRWVSACLYVEQAALVRLQIAPVIIPYVSNLESCFTSYQLKNVAQMTSVYAIRLYELLTQYKSIGSRYIDLADLRDFLGAIEKSYDRLDNFKKKVLDVGIDQVNQYTDLVVSYIPKKVGRSVVGYNFSIDQKAMEKPNPKKSNSSTAPLASPPLLNQGLSTAERALLRDKQQLFPDLNLTESSVIEMARQQNTDVYLVLAGIK
jgi:plasmid replication initiation protein